MIAQMETNSSSAQQSRWIILTILALGFILGSTTSTYAEVNLVTNGSFEAGIPFSGGFVDLNSGSPAIAGWTITRNDVSYVGSGWTASNGSRSVELNGNVAGGAISQSFLTVPGVAYALLFDMGRNPDDASVKKLRVTVGTQSQDFTFESRTTTRTVMGWTTPVLLFTATDAQTNLTFESLNNGSFGAALDNVRVVPSTTLVVTKPDDTNDGSCDPADCSLREAIAAASPDGYSVINFSPSMSGQTIALTGDELLINGNLTINGPGAALLTVDAKLFAQSACPGPPPMPFRRVFEIAAGAAVQIANLKVTGGCNTPGGGILNNGFLALNSCTVSGNHAGADSGGAVGNRGVMTLNNCNIVQNRYSGISNSGVLTVTGSTISENTGFPNFGGGIYNPGLLTVINSTIYHNTSDSGAGIENPGIAEVINSTIAGNGASTVGGAISATGSSHLILRNTTVSANSVALSLNASGGISVGSRSLVELQNSIVVNNTLQLVRRDCVGQLVSLGHNLVGNCPGLSMQPSDRQLSDAEVGSVLDAYTDPGAPGQGRFPLLPNSPAIDAADDTVCNDLVNHPELATDQLGSPRPADGNGDGARSCDIGAVEFYPIVDSLVSLDAVSFRSFGPGDAGVPVLPFAPAGIFRVGGLFSNASGKNICNVAFQVVQLSTPNVMIDNFGNLLGGVGTILRPAVPAEVKDIPNGEEGKFVFTIGLASSNQFNFFVNMLGDPSFGSCPP